MIKRFKKLKKLSRKLMVFTIMFSLIFSGSVFTNESNAAGVAGSKISDALSDSRPNEFADHTIEFMYNNESTIVSGDTQTFTFTGFTQGATASATADFVINVGATDSYGTALVQTTDFTVASSGTGANPVYTVSWLANAATELNTKPYVQIVFTNASDKLPNPSAGVYTVTLGGATNYATGYFKVITLDGITVTATVEEYLTFAISDTEIGFGSWTGGTTEERFANSAATGDTSEPVSATDPSQLTISSNATDGISVTVKSINANSTAGLYNAGAGTTIAADSSDDIVAASEGFAVYASASSSMTIDDGFDDNASGGLAVTTGNLLFASNTGAVSGATVDLEMNAAIATTTAAGAYATTVIFVATPSY